MRIVTPIATMILFALIQLGAPGCAQTGVFIHHDTEDSAEDNIIVSTGNRADGGQSAADDAGSNSGPQLSDTSDVAPFADSENNDSPIADTATPGGDASSDSGIVLSECTHTSATVDRIQPRVMILQDRSSSMNMNDKWIMAKDAITSVVNSYNNRIWFGLDLFSSPLAQSDELCTVADSPLLDAAPQNAESIIENLDMYEPARSTPLLRAMYNYSAEPDAGYAPDFQTGGNGNSTLIVVSDGQDTCGVDGIFGFETSATSAQLGEAADTLLKYYGIQTVAIGMGQQASPESLNAIAASGGSVFSEYFQTDSGEALQEALEAVAKEITAHCDFSVSWSGTPNPLPNQLALEINGEIIPEVAGDCADGHGWFWAEDSALARITLCASSCSQVNETDKIETDFRALCVAHSIPYLE